MKQAYLILALVGAILPFIFFFQFIETQGLDLLAFSSALFVNGAAAGFTVDLLLASFIFWIFMFQQAKRANGPKKTQDGGKVALRTKSGQEFS